MSRRVAREASFLGDRVDAGTTAGAVLVGIRRQIGRPVTPRLVAAILALQTLGLVSLGLRVPGGPLGIYAGYFVLPALYAVGFLLIFLWSRRDPAPAGIVVCMLYATAPVVELLEVMYLVRSGAVRTSRLSESERALALSAIALWLALRIGFFVASLWATRADARRAARVSAYTTTEPAFHGPRAADPQPPRLPRRPEPTSASPAGSTTPAWNVLLLGFAILALAMAADAGRAAVDGEPLARLGQALQLGNPILLLALGVAGRIVGGEAASDPARQLAPAVRLLGVWLLLVSGVSGAQMVRLLAAKNAYALHDEHGSLELMGYLAPLATNGAAAIACLVLSRRRLAGRVDAPPNAVFGPGHRPLPRPAPATASAIVLAALAVLQMAVLVIALDGQTLAGRGSEVPFADLVPTAQSALATLTLVVAVSGVALFTDRSFRRRLPWSAVAAAGFAAFAGLFVLRATRPSGAASNLPLLPLASDLSSAGLMVLLASLLPMAAEADSPRIAARSAIAGRERGVPDSSGRSAPVARRALGILRRLTNDVEGSGQWAFRGFAVLVLGDAVFRLMKIRAMDPGLFWPTRRLEVSGAVLVALIEAGASLFTLRRVGAGVWHLLTDGPEPETRWTRTLGVGRNVWLGLAVLRGALLLWSLPGDSYEVVLIHGAFVTALLLDVAKGLVAWRWRAAWASVEEPLPGALDRGTDDARS